MQQKIPPSVPRNLLVPIVRTKRSAVHKNKKKEDKDKSKSEDLAL